MMNSPNAYEQNKAFTKHIVEAMIKAHEEKLELELSIQGNYMMSGNLLLKLRLKIMNVMLFYLRARVSTIAKILCDVLSLTDMEECSLNLHLADSTIKKPFGRINDVLILANRNYVHVDYIVLDIECNRSCPIILGRAFLDMKKGNIRFQFPLNKGMEHFPRKIVKPPYASTMRSTYGITSKDENT